MAESPVKTDPLSPAGMTSLSCEENAVSNTIKVGGDSSEPLLNHMDYVDGDRNLHASAGNAVASREPCIADMTRTRRGVMTFFVCLAVVTSCINLSQLGPFLFSAALARHPGGGAGYHTAIGAIFSMVQIGVVVSSPFITHDLPNIGSKQLLVLAGCVHGVFSNLFSSLHWIRDWKVFLAYAYVMRFVQGMAFAATTIGAQTYLTRIHPSNLGLVNSLMIMNIALGDVIGVVLSGGLHDIGGFPLPFYVTGAIALLGAVCLALIVFDMDRLLPAEQVADGKTGSVVSISRVLRVPWIWFLILQVVASNFAFSSVAALLGYYMKSEFHVQSVIRGLALGSQVFFQFVSAPVVGKLTDRGFNCYLLVLLGLLLSVAGCLLIGPSAFLHLRPSLVLVVVVTIPLGAGHSLMAVASLVAMTQHLEMIGVGSTVDTRFAVAGLARFFLSAGYGMTPLVMSPLVAVLGFPAAFTILAFVYLALAGLLVVLKWLDIIVGKLKLRFLLCCADQHSAAAMAEPAGNPFGDGTELQPLKHH
ncbi:MFS-type transporter SLC18B1-like [Sycon ciliatum]|uniref:MFS-type transporter SLC18B1-like n=1 Tax=Sycon ciliatum TaxID=27933 RepID=UPI0031F6582B